MFLLKLLGFKWSRCDLTPSTLNQPYAVVMKNCQAQKIHFFNIYSNDDGKIYVQFLFSPGVWRSVFFAGLVYFSVAWSSQNLKSSI